MAEESKADRPLGSARMKVRDKDVTGVSVNGRTYTPDAKGFVYVRPEDIVGCLSHGHQAAYE